MTTPDMTTQPEFLANNLDLGRYIEAKDFISSADAAVSMQELIAGMDREILTKRDLSKFAEIDNSHLAKTVCLPTSTLMAIRHLSGDSTLTLANFYELGINAHINDRTLPSGEIEKGFPSFHRNSFDTYLRYALDFAKINGLSGGIITTFNDMQFSREALRRGVVILSVDNLIIPEVMNTAIDGSTFKPSRHAEFIHGQKGESLIVSDVQNAHEGLSWESRNRQISVDVMKQYLTSPRLNDSLTRAIILTSNQTDWENTASNLSQYGRLEDENSNPILKPYLGKGIEVALSQTREAVAKGLSQWEMIPKAA